MRSIHRGRANWRGIVIATGCALASFVALLGSVAAPASAASGTHFTCRASASRVELGSGSSAQTIEPAVANSKNDPCASDHAQVGSSPSGASSLLTADVESATTTSQTGLGSSSSFVTNPVAAGLSADHASASASYTCSNGAPKPVASSDVVNLRDGNGQPITSSGSVSLPAGGVADVELNRTIKTATSVTQRAEDITIISGPNAGAHIVVGEAIAGISGDPCASPASGAPVNTKLPAIASGPNGKAIVSGSAEAGKTLTCVPGSWTNDPTRFTYQWSRDGTPIAGATGHTYTVRTGDEGLTLSCTVTAINAAGLAGTAKSQSVRVKVPVVRGCPRATGRVTAKQLGLARLGMTRAQAHRAFTHSNTRGQRFEDFFCLTPRGIRVGYASNKALTTVPARARKALRGRVIWVSTSYAFYAVHGVRAGSRLAAARRHLKLAGPFHIGLNYWYLAPNGGSTVVLKVRHGIVQEVGIANAKFTRGQKAQLTFLKSFS
jgi:hypothetical protein